MTDLTFRPFELEKDSTSYIALLNKIASSKGEPQVTEEAQLEQAKALQEASITRDILVAKAEDKIIGFVEVWKIPQTLNAPVIIGVHPEWQKQGLGQTLLKHAQQRARGLGATAFLAYAKPDDAEAQAFFTENNFVAVSGYRKMSLVLESELTTPQWSEGFNVLPYAQVAKSDLYTEASRKGWSDLWGHTTPTEETTAATLEMFPPDGIFLLFSGEEVVGVCKTQLETDRKNNDAPTGYVDAPGIAPKYRDEVNYRNILLEALHWLYERGQRRVVLESWGELDMALAAYESLGFTLDEHELGYALSL